MASQRSQNNTSMAGKSEGKTNKKGFKTFLVIVLWFAAFITLITNDFEYASLFGFLLLLIAIVYLLVKLFSLIKKPKKADTISAQQERTPQQNSIPPTHSISPSKNPPHSLQGMEIAYRYSNVEVAGVKYTDTDLNLISIGDKVEIIPEPDNPHDSKAIRLEIQGNRIGYMYRGKLQVMVGDWFQKNLPIWACVSSIDVNDNKIEMLLVFYDVVEYEKLINSDRKSKVFRLTGNTNEEMQDEIDNVSEGDEVLLSYDDEKDKYLVNAIGDGDIGYLPASGVQYIDEIEDYKAYVDRTETTDSGKSVVYVRIFES